MIKFDKQVLMSMKTKQISKQSGVYTIKNRITGETYVGETSNLSKRIRNHKANINQIEKQNCKLYKAVKNSPAGWSDFMVTTYTINGATREERQYVEKALAQHYTSIGKSLNSNLGKGGFAEIPVKSTCTYCGTVDKYDNAYQAQNECGYDNAHINKCLSGKNKTHGKCIVCGGRLEWSKI